MPADPMFWYALLLKMAMTASIVVAASVLVERSGPFIGALIASMPTAGGAAMIILAIEHPPAFVAESAIGGMVSNVVCAVFALTYAALAQRWALPVSLAGAFVVWFAAAALSRTVAWTALLALVLNVAVLSATVWVGLRFRGGDGVKTKVTLTGRDVAWRASVVTAVVITVTLMSHWIGSFASGLFAFFPVAMSSFFIILHSRLGGQAAASVAAHVQAPLFGLCLGLLFVHLCAESLGVWWSYLGGLCVGLVWNAMLWLIRHRRTRTISAAR